MDKGERTLEDAFGRWKAVSRKAPRTIRRYDSSIRSWIHFGIVRLADATRERVAAGVEFRLLDCEPVTVNTDLAALTAVLSFAERALGEFPFQELQKIRRLNVPVKRKRRMTATFLSWAQVDELLRVARARAPSVEIPILVAVYTGLRVGELARMRWREIDLARRELVVIHHPELGDDGAAKTGDRQVPMCDALLELLTSRRAELGSDFLFVPGPDALGRASGNAFTPSATLRHQLERIRDRAAVPEAEWTVFRHTRAAWWLQGDPPVPIERVAFWLGNSIAVCERYYGALKRGYDPLCNSMPPRGVAAPGDQREIVVIDTGVSAAATLPAPPERSVETKPLEEAPLDQKTTRVMPREQHDRLDAGVRAMHRRPT